MNVREFWSYLVAIWFLSAILIVMPARSADTRAYAPT